MIHEPFPYPLCLFQNQSSFVNVQSRLLNLQTPKLPRFILRALIHLDTPLTHLLSQRFKLKLRRQTATSFQSHSVRLYRGIDLRIDGSIDGTFDGWTMRRVSMSTHQDDGMLGNVDLAGFGEGVCEMCSNSGIADEEVLLFAFFIDLCDIEYGHVGSCHCQLSSPKSLY